MASTIFLGLCALLPLLVAEADGARILLMPADHGSHVNYFMVTGSSLRDAGHQVHVLTVSRHRGTAEEFAIPGTILEGNFEEYYELLEDAVFSGNVGKVVDAFADLGLIELDKYLKHEVIMSELKAMKFDLVIIDGAPPARHQYIIPYKLGVRYVTLTPASEAWLLRLPSMPSAEPSWLATYHNKELSFLERLISLMTVFRIHMMFPPAQFKDDLIAKYAPEMPVTTFEELFLNSEMWLINWKNICLDSPRVYSPHVQYVGGINTRPAKPLPDDLENFIKTADAGLVLVSFGSAVKKMPMEILVKMVKAFSRIEQKVIMRFDGEMANVPPNVRFMKWLPQNDILGHNKTRLFITHAGNNGQLEALYHGIPMLSMPMAVDQHRNALRSQHRGYGKTLNPFEVEVDEILATITHMLENTTYRNNIRECSAKYRDFPSPQDTLLFYVNHVIKFGGSHLKPTYLRMPLWKFFMLDVLAFLLLSVIIVLVLIYMCTRIILKRCSASTKKQKED